MTSLDIHYPYVRPPSLLSDVSAEDLVCYSRFIGEIRPNLPESCVHLRVSFLGENAGLRACALGRNGGLMKLSDER